VGGRIHAVELMMGTAISLDVVDAPSVVDADELKASVFAWFTEVDERFSTFKADSEVSRLNRGEVAAADLSPDMRHVLDACESLREASNGYFDAYATGSLDPSGYVKGWSVQVASDRLLAAGLPNHCVNAGGDIRIRGVAPDGEPWRVGIRHPWEKLKVAWVVAGDDLAIATSGTYERGFHVIDPFSGRPADGLTSVTMVGRDLATADAYATAAIAMGKRALDWLPTLPDYSCAVVASDGSAYTSAGLPVVPPTAAGDADLPVY
jgi:thiamine biosynthesis lipoprotein